MQRQLLASVQNETGRCWKTAASTDSVAQALFLQTLLACRSNTIRLLYGDDRTTTPDVLAAYDDNRATSDQCAERQRPNPC